MDKDFHYYGTYVAACYANFSSDEAQIIANAAQYVDDLTKFRLIRKEEYTKYSISVNLIQTSQDLIKELAWNAITPKGWIGPSISDERQIWIPFHFLPGNYESTILPDPNYETRKKTYNGPQIWGPWIWSYDKNHEIEFNLMCLPDSPLSIDMINELKNHQGEPYYNHLIGIRMHVLADTVAHEYYSGTPAWHVNAIDYDVSYYNADSGSWEKVPFTDFPTSKGEERTSDGFTSTSDFYLGHGRMGHIPDYPWIKYKYIPKWNENSKTQILKDNTAEYLTIFKKMVAALKCIKDPKKPFDIHSIDETIDPKYISAIEEILKTKQDFGLDDNGGRDRCSSWIRAIRYGLLGPLVSEPEEYNPETWIIEAKVRMSKVITDTDYYNFNIAATMHLNYVKTSLENDGIPFDIEQIKPIPPVSGNVFTLAKTKNEQAVVIYYFDKSNHVYKLNRWIAKDLTTEASASPAGPNGSLTILPVGSNPVIYYTDANNHVVELQYFNGKLQYGDLTSAAGGQHPVKSGSMLASIANANFTAVYYIDSNNHVYELRYDGKKWNITDLTMETNGLPADINGSLTILPLLIGSNPVIYYTGKNNHVYELQYLGGQLHANDLTLAAGGEHPVKSGSTLSSIANANFTAVYYIDSNNHVCELRYDGKKWNITDFTTETGGLPADPKGNLTTLPLLNGSNPVIYYTGKNNHVYELQYLGGQLHANDLTLAAGGEHPVKSGSTLSSIANANFTAVYYIDSNNHVCELRYEGQGKKWNVKDLMPSASNS